VRLYNTLSRAVEEVVPVEPGRVKMYACGPTVYRSVHLGNLRTFMLADLVRRVAEFEGYAVTLVQNITDVGHMTDELTDDGRDKMLLAADDEGLSTAEIAAKYTEAFFADTDAVNIRRADVYPKATDHIPQIIELISKLVERGHAYESGGNVYYDVTSFPAYGQLSHQSLDDMRAGHRIEGIDQAKRNHQDFVLWRAAGPRRELVYPSPWGPGYPGWHIECSAMSLQYLGERFDIHTAGIDLRFPHHEGEIAQSEGAVGHPVVKLWVHGEHLLMGQAKMAKSAGNVVTIRDVVAQGHDPLAFRYLCFTGRYRRQVHLTDDALGAAGTALRRLRDQVALTTPGAESSPTATALSDRLTDDRAAAYHQRFVAAIDDDLDLPAAMRAVHEALADESVPGDERWALAASWDEVLGLDLVGGGDLQPDLAVLVREREEARAAGDYSRADDIRDRLRSAGVELLDSPAGTRWVRR
jgi:cysteinyl-tRNA synthetase